MSKDISKINQYSLTELDKSNRTIITKALNNLKDDNTNKFALYSGNDGVETKGSKGVMVYLATRMTKVFGANVDELHPALWPLCATCIASVHNVMLIGMDKGLTRTTIKKNMWETVDSFESTVTNLKKALQI